MKNVETHGDLWSILKIYVVLIFAFVVYHKIPNSGYKSDVHLGESQIRKQQSDPACVLFYFQPPLSAYLVAGLNSVVVCVCVCGHLHTSVKDYFRLLALITSALSWEHLVYHPISSLPLC